MSKTRYRWWSFVKQMIRDYPKLVSDWTELHSTQVTASYTAMPSGAGARRSVEDNALKRLPPDDQKAFDAIRSAVDYTRHLQDGPRRLELIRLVYWVDRPMLLKYAALRLFISEVTAKRWHRDFVRAVARAYGFNLCQKDDTPEPK